MLPGDETQGIYLFLQKFLQKLLQWVCCPSNPGRLLSKE
jgi:hypothetical protein